MRFRKSSNGYALLVDGARQVGKTSIIEDFGRKHYARHSALSRLMSDPEYDFPQSFVFNDKTSKTEVRISYLPIYLLSFLRPTPLPEKMIFEI